jgi:Domain of unknown function (DUF4465)/Secretion system C-terminal sorting domain
MKKINLFFALLFFARLASAQATSDFESLTLGTDTFWSGSDLSGGFANGHAFFVNQYDTGFGGYWAGGFIYSNKTDITTAGYTNPASAITGGGVNGSQKYAVAYDMSDSNVVVRLTQSGAGRAVQGFYVTNTTYAYLSMLHGDNFENAFTAAHNDSLVLRVYGYHNGVLNPGYVPVYLANFSFADTTQNYILHTWQWVNLLALGNVDSLLFTMASSQSEGNFPSTPTYFAMDNFVTTDLAVFHDTILYNQDTLLNVLDGVVDTAGGPFTVEFIRNSVPGASIVVDSANLIWYIPQDGIVGTDTVVYAICNASHVCDTSEVIISLLSPTTIRTINTLQTQVYPNPCSNTLMIYHTSGVHTINLYDLEGRLIETAACNTGERKTNINTGALQPGTYIVKAISDQGVGIAKVIKQ